jgi:phosphatidate cytidylyltransferase
VKERLFVAAVGIPLTAAVVWFAPDILFLCVVGVVAVICIIELMSSGRKTSLLPVAVLILGSFSLLAAFKVRNGSLMTLMVFGCAYLSDGGAMLLGSRFGKKHPFPKVSPNKTDMGVIGGLIAPMIFSLLFVSEIGVAAALVIGLILGVAAEAGDLFFSFIKRKIGIKDYGNILPGHGGMLDRFDSVILVAPMAYLIWLIM